MHTAQTNKTHTPFVVFFLAFHSSSCAFVLASTFTSRFLSPICRSWSSRKARNVDSGSLYSQKPKAGTHIGMEIDMRTWSNVYLQSEFRVCHGSKCSSTYNVHFVYYKLPWSLPEAPWTLFQLRTIPHFCKVREKKESCQLQKMSLLHIILIQTGFVTAVFPLLPPTAVWSACLRLSLICFPQTRLWWAHCSRRLWHSWQQFPS